MRGEVTVAGISSGRIPWPIGKTHRAKSPVLYGDLLRAIRMESPSAIRYWWGIGSDRIRKWRRALEVGETEGTMILRKSLATPEKIAKINAAAVLKARDPERRAKIAAAKRGVPRPTAVIAKMREAKKGTKHSDSVRQKMSNSHKQRGTRPPKAGRSWEAWEDQLLRKLPPTEVAKKTSRTLTAVFTRRSLLQVPDGRRRKQR